jgi:alpha-amylase
MFIGRHFANSEWTDILGYHGAPVIIDKRGYGIFPVKAMSVSVWVSVAAVEQDKLHKDLYVISPTSGC